MPLAIRALYSGELQLRNPDLKYKKRRKDPSQETEIDRLGSQSNIRSPRFCGNSVRKMDKNEEERQCLFITEQSSEHIDSTSPNVFCL